jgi:predicted  nucleic acid-binding Zn-ribbon protein
MTDSTEQLKIDVAEARGIVFDLDEELSMTRIERDRLRNSLHIVNQANEGHVRMIADLAAERDGWKDNAVDTLRQLERVARERDELRDELIRRTPEETGAEW